MSSIRQLIRRGVGALVRNQSIQACRVPAYSLLNVGCGSEASPGFVRLDWEWRSSIHLCWDIRKRIPLGASSFTGIFTEHCLEHVSHEECAHVLKDFYRLLQPGGTLRVIVPDGGLYLDLYNRSVRGESVEFPYLDAVGKQDLSEDSRYGFTPMMAVNRIFRGYGHQFAYDADTMANLLRQAGFTKIKRCTFRSGRMPDLLIDSELRAPQSLFMEATR